MREIRAAGTAQRTQDLVTRAIRVELARRNESQALLADRLEKPAAWLSRRMVGDVAFSTDDLDLVADGLRLTVHALLTTQAA